MILLQLKIIILINQLYQIRQHIHGRDVLEIVNIVLKIQMIMKINIVFHLIVLAEHILHLIREQIAMK